MPLRVQQVRPNRRQKGVSKNDIHSKQYRDFKAVLQELGKLNKLYVGYKGDKSINKSAVKFQEFLDGQLQAGPKAAPQQETAQRGEEKPKPKKQAKAAPKIEAVKVPRRMTRSQTRKLKQQIQLELQTKATEQRERAHQKEERVQSPKKASAKKETTPRKLVRI